MPRIVPVTFHKICWNKCIIHISFYYRFLTKFTYVSYYSERWQACLQNCWNRYCAWELRQLTIELQLSQSQSRFARTSDGVCAQSDVRTSNGGCTHCRSDRKQSPNMDGITQLSWRFAVSARKHIFVLRRANHLQQSSRSTKKTPWLLIDLAIGIKIVVSDLYSIWNKSSQWLPNTPFASISECLVS